MEEDFSKFVHGFSITSVGIFYSAIMFYGGALVAVNLLGPKEYGVYSLAFMIPNVLIFFLLFGLDITAARYIAHHLGKDSREKALKCAQTIFVVRIPIAFLSMIVFFLLAEHLALVLGQDVVTGLKLLSAYICLFLIARYQLAVLQGYFLLKERTLVEAVTNTLNLVFLVPLVFAGFGYISPILSFLGASAVGIVQAWYYLERAHIPVFRVQFEGIKALKEYLKFSYYVYISDSFHISYVWVGAVVIALYALPVEFVGYYRAMFSVTSTVVLVSYGLTIVLYPMLSELNARKEYERLAFSLRTVIKYALGISIPAAMGMLLLSRPLVAFLFPRYIPAVNLLRIFSFRMVFLPLWSILATALLTLGREKRQSQFSVFLCSSSLVLSLILGVISLEGIALASTVGLALAVSLQYRELKNRVDNLNAGPVWKVVLSSGIMCVVICGILQLDVPDYVKVFASLFGGIVVYALCILRMKAVTPVDIQIMHSGVSVFGRAGKVFEVFLNLAERILGM
ncbi:MAG: oligosaccharide flippase family protein [Theionarchaea archaeon]|nr:oligosaccharide flippase family protein [Theionarchaea archaeon]MBU7038911.1 oligosaccharide flippase family protein [Theionarchaea archaeon]